MRQGLLILLVSFAVTVAYQACGPVAKPGASGTDTGNPLNARPAYGEVASSTSLALTLCMKITSCHPTALECVDHVSNQNGLPTFFGAVPGMPTTISGLAEAEMAGDLTADSSNLASCRTAIDAIPCNDPAVQAVFQNGVYGDVGTLVPTAAGACAKVY